MSFRLTCLIFLLLYPFPSFGQSSERPEGIVIPVSILGNVSETRRQILQNTLIESLSQYYRLVPQDKFEEVQEKVFQELEYEECTEDQCIVMIQEMLQVENLFVLQVIGESQDTQLSLKWVGLDDKRIKTDYCEDCKTKELNLVIAILVKEMVGQISQIEVVPTEYIEAEVKKIPDKISEVYTTKFRGIIGSGSSDKTEFNNMSFFLGGKDGVLDCQISFFKPHLLEGTNMNYTINH